MSDDNNVELEVGSLPPNQCRLCPAVIGPLQHSLHMSNNHGGKAWRPGEVPPPDSVPATGTTTERARSSPRYDAPPTTKPCPYCAETIQAQAKKCKHCGEFLTPGAVAERAESAGSSSTMARNVIGIIALACVVTGLVVGLLPVTDYETAPRSFGETVECGSAFLPRDSLLTEFGKNACEEAGRSRNRTIALVLIVLGVALSLGVLAVFKSQKDSTR